jgi:hypothetical protein
MDGRLTEGTAAGDLILLQPQTEPPAQDLFYFPMDTFSWGTKSPPPVSEVDLAPLVSSGIDSTHGRLIFGCSR